MEESNPVRDFSVAENRGQAGIAQQEGKEIQEELRIVEQDGNKAREQLRISESRTYLECLNISERILIRYIPRGKKPLRFLKTFADELFEKRIKESTEAYHEFLEAKIMELQMRDGRLSRFRALRIPYGKHGSFNESCWGRGIWKQ